MGGHFIYWRLVNRPFEKDFTKASSGRLHVQADSPTSFRMLSAAAIAPAGVAHALQARLSRFPRSKDFTFATRLRSRGKSWVAARMNNRSSMRSSLRQCFSLMPGVPDRHDQILIYGTAPSGPSSEACG